MASLRQGSIKLFNLEGVDLYLHWSWFFVAIIEIIDRGKAYTFIFWNVLEYLTLFLIVILHEYGHALACRQVGGKVDRIVLWPLGGVAFVEPPPRPGATLWSIAAGPLVNLALTPVLAVAYFFARWGGLALTAPDAYKFVKMILALNVFLLAFNLVPIYPLDGGQILRSLLWYVFGRTRSLQAVSVIGFLGVAGLTLIGVWRGDMSIGIIAIFILANCYSGLVEARNLTRIATARRRGGLACPNCGFAPPIGDFWLCQHCQLKFDAFLNQAKCPLCLRRLDDIRCVDCNQSYSTNEWATAATVGVASR